MSLSVPGDGDMPTIPKEFGVAVLPSLRNPIPSNRKIPPGRQEDRMTSILRVQFVRSFVPRRR
jgi:hypothetical protein